MDTLLTATGHERTWSPHLWLRRLGIIAVALVINFVLFGLMPYLLIRHPAGQPPQPEINRINVIRFKNPEAPATPIKATPPQPPPERQAPPPAPVQPVMAQLSLPFDINPRLPEGPKNLTLPVIPTAVPTDIAEIFAVDDLDSPLTVLARIPPIYPLTAKSRSVEGWVKVRFIVHEDGEVGNVSVVASDPQKIFDDAVIRSVSGWRFKAGSIAGTPVKAWAETVVRFKLD